MKLAIRYILRELFVPFLVGIALFTGIFMLNGLYSLTESVVSHGLSFPRMLLLVLAGLPQTLLFTAPMAVILAVLMGYGRLAADNELTALRVAGFPLTSLVLPALLSALILSLGLLGLRQFGQPALGRFRTRLVREMSVPSPARLLSEESYLELGDYTIFAEDVNGLKMSGVYLEDKSIPRPADIYARRGEWIKKSASSYVLRLEDGTMHQRGKDGNYRRIKFKTQEVKVNFGRSLEEFGSTNKVYSIVELYRRKVRLWEKYLEVGDGKSDEAKERLKEYRSQALDFHRAIALPLAPFFLVLLSAPLGMLARRSGKAVGFVGSLSIIFGYYLMLVLLDQLAVGGWLSPEFSPWVPNLLCGASGTILLYMLWRRGG